MPDTAEPSFESFLEESYDITSSKNNPNASIEEKGTLTSEAEIFLTVLQALAEQHYEENGYETKVLRTWEKEMVIKAIGSSKTLKITFSQSDSHSVRYEVERIK